MRTPMKISLTEKDHTILGGWVKSRAVGDKLRLRARMVLMTAYGFPTMTIMATLTVSTPTLNKWWNPNVIKLGNNQLIYFALL